MLRLLVLAKRLFTISVVTLAMVVASGGSLTAQDSPAPKIGVFNAERIMTESVLIMTRILIPSPSL